MYKKEKIRMNKKGFTLAEILIGMGIIGVVSALTIPNLITKYQKRQTAQRLKVIYTKLDQAVKLSSVENDDISGWNFEQSGKDFFDQYLLKYIKIIKKRDSNNLKWEKIYFYQLNGNKETGLWVSYSPVTIYTTINGTDILVNNTAISGTFIGNSYFLIYIDLNGFDNGPNKGGKDIFSIDLNKDKGLYFNGTYNTSEYTFETEPNNDRKVLLGKKGSKSGSWARYGCSKDLSTSSCMWCGRLIQVDNWEIKDDYPW